jgi:hypothetical protein
MAWAIEAYEAQGAIALAQQFSYSDLHLLLEQTSKLRRDPEEHRKAVDKAETEQWLIDNQSTQFVSEDGDIFSMEEFEFL